MAPRLLLIDPPEQFAAMLFSEIDELNGDAMPLVLPLARLHANECRGVGSVRHSVRCSDPGASDPNALTQIDQANTVCIV